MENFSRRPIQSVDEKILKSSSKVSCVKICPIIAPFQVNQAETMQQLDVVFLLSLRANLNLLPPCDAVRKQKKIF